MSKTIGEIINGTRDSFKKAKDWVLENPQATVSIISSVALLLRASQSFVVSHRLYSQQNRKDHTFYDRSSGHYWQLRRKLNNADRAVIDRRKKKGDDMFDILSDLGVI